MNQILLFLKMFSNPKQVFLALPSDRFFVLAWIAPYYFSLARSYNKGNIAGLESLMGSTVAALAFFTVLAVVFIPLGAWITKLIASVFRKNLSVRKIMNIYGYALAPRIVATILFYACSFFVDPFQLENPGLYLKTFAYLGLTALALSLILFVYGIVVCPSEIQEIPEEEPDLPLV